MAGPVSLHPNHWQTLPTQNTPKTFWVSTAPLAHPGPYWPVTCQAHIICNGLEIGQRRRPTKAMVFSGTVSFQRWCNWSPDHWCCFKTAKPIMIWSLRISTPVLAHPHPNVSRHDGRKTASNAFSHIPCPPLPFFSLRFAFSFRLTFPLLSHYCQSIQFLRIYVPAAYFDLESC